MKIIEEFIKGKKNDQSLCEDGYILKPHFVAVIDGVTAKGNHLWEGRASSGRYAMEKVKEYLSGDVEDKTAEELFSECSRVLKEEYKKIFQEDIAAEKLRACIIVYNEKYNEIWSYGDCQCMVDGVHYQDNKKIDDIITKKRVEIVRNALKNGMSEEELLINDIGRNAITDDLLKQFSYENKKCELGYPVLNGDDIIPEMIKKHSVQKGSEIVLASDGYPVLYKTLEESETELKRLIETDPLCIGENASSKGVQPGCLSFDDRCYIRFVTD